MNAKFHQLVDLAIEITQAGKAHVFVSYAGHTRGVTVYAHPEDQEYGSDHPARYLVRPQTIYLEWPEADEELDAAIAKLSALLTKVAAA